MTEVQLRLELADAREQTITTMRDRYHDDLHALAERHDAACHARYGTASPYAPLHRECDHEAAA